jgi:hypothetical protein
MPKAHLERAREVLALLDTPVVQITLSRRAVVASNEVRATIRAIDVIRKRID